MWSHNLQLEINLFKEISSSLQYYSVFSAQLGNTNQILAFCENTMSACLSFISFYELLGEINEHLAIEDCPTNSRIIHEIYLFRIKCFHNNHDKGNIN